MISDGKKSSEVEKSDSADEKVAVSEQNPKPNLSSRFGSICWLNMLANESNSNSVEKDRKSEKTGNGDNSAGTSGQGRSNNIMTDPNNCCTRWLQKLITVVKWVFNDFRLRHLVWIKFIFFFQSASMTILYPYLNLHMKSLGLSIQEVAVINAVIPILFIFTPPLAGFMADKVGNFRVLLSVLTALGGIFALLLLAIPPARDTSPYPENLKWGISCGRPGNRARYQKLMLHGFKRDECELIDQPDLTFDNITFTPGTCGYLCPTRSKLDNVRPRFAEYKVNKSIYHGFTSFFNDANFCRSSGRIVAVASALPKSSMSSRSTPRRPGPTTSPTWWTTTFSFP